MDKILVSPEELRSKAEKLRIHAATITRLLRNVDHEIHTLGSLIFEGERADQLRSRYYNQREKIFASPDLIMSFARSLDEAAKVFEQADKSNIKEPQTGKENHAIDLVIALSDALLSGGRGNLSAMLKNFGLSKSVYDIIKCGVPKQSTKFGQFLKYSKVIGFAGGTALDFWKSEDHSTDAFMTSWYKNAIEIPLAKVMLVNLAVQLTGEGIKFAEDKATPFITSDHEVQADLTFLNDQLAQTFTDLDLGHITKDLGAISWHTSPLYYTYQSTNNYINLLKTGFGADNTFWQAPSIGRAFDLFMEVNGDYVHDELQSYPNNLNLIWGDIKDLGGDVGTFALGAANFPEALIKNDLGYFMALSAKTVDLLPLSDDFTSTYQDVSKIIIDEISYIPSSSERAFAQWDLLLSGIKAGDVSSVYDSALDLWNFGFTSQVPGLSTDFLREIAEVVDHTMQRAL